MARSRAPYVGRRRAAAVLVAAAVPAIVACNGLLGIDEYEKVACTGGFCDGGVDAPRDATNDADRTAPPVDAQGTQPVAWAKFRMPNYLEDGGPDANLA